MSRFRAIDLRHCSWLSESAFADSAPPEDATSTAGTRTLVIPPGDCVPPPHVSMQVPAQVSNCHGRQTQISRPFPAVQNGHSAADRRPSGARGAGEGPNLRSSRDTSTDRVGPPAHPRFSAHRRTPPRFPADTRRRPTAFEHTRTVRRHDQPMRHFATIEAWVCTDQTWKTTRSLGHAVELQYTGTSPIGAGRSTTCPPPWVSPVQTSTHSPAGR